MCHVKSSRLTATSLLTDLHPDCRSMRVHANVVLGRAAALIAIRFIKCPTMLSRGIISVSAPLRSQSRARLFARRAGYHVDAALPSGSAPSAAPVLGRSVLKLTGRDVSKFLKGLVSRDVGETPGHGGYSGFFAANVSCFLLTPTSPDTHANMPGRAESCMMSSSIRSWKHHHPQRRRPHLSSSPTLSITPPRRNPSSSPISKSLFSDQRSA